MCPPPPVPGNLERANLVSMSEDEAQVAQEDSLNKHLQIAVPCLGCPDSANESPTGFSVIGSEGA